jgi:mono/diheme cytochrome c family protein
MYVVYDEILQLFSDGVADPAVHPAPMPPKGGSNISEDQIRAVAAYVWTLANRG